MNKTLLIILFLLAFISFASAQAKEQYLVNTKTLNLRSGPGQEFSIIGSIAMGDMVYLVNKTDSLWWEVNFEGKAGFVYSPLLKIDPYNGWDKTNYTSGSTPECENITPIFDDSLDNFLKVSVGSGTDVVVKLMRKDSKGDKCIRIVYIRSGDTYDIKNIPEGFYYLKIAYGTDFRKKIIDSVCYMKFMKNAIYEIGNKVLNFNLTKNPDRIQGNMIYESWDVPSFELFLEVTQALTESDEFKTDAISEKEFNK